MKHWMAIAVAALLTGAGVWYYWNVSRANAAQSESPRFTAERAEYRPLRAEVSCSGSVESNQDVEIKCKATGQVIELPYDISEPVNKGDLLLKIDPVDEERTVRQAGVKLASSEAKLARVQQSLVIAERELEKSRKETGATMKAAQVSRDDLRTKAERTATLRKKGQVCQEEVESAEVAAVQAESTMQKASAGVDGVKIAEEQLELLRQDIKLAQADAESMKIELETANQRMKETQVFAPIAGIVSARMVQVGQIIASPTMNVGGGTALLTLSDLSRVFVLASVDESDVGEVRQKQPATITVDAFPDEHFAGEVVRVATKGTKVSNIVTFEVKIEVLDEAKRKLLPEMTADVEILVASKERTLAVPSEAIQRRGAGKIVLIPGGTEKEAAPVAVETGIDDGAFTEIVSGLEEGSTILIPQEDVAAKKKEEGGSGGFPGPPPGGGPPPM